MTFLVKQTGLLDSFHDGGSIDVRCISGAILQLCGARYQQSSSQQYQFRRMAEKASGMERRPNKRHETQHDQKTNSNEQADTWACSQLAHSSTAIQPAIVMRPSCSTAFQLLRTASSTISGSSEETSGSGLWETLQVVETLGGSHHQGREVNKLSTKNYLTALHA